MNEFCSFTRAKARNAYRCDHCFGAIDAGEVYVRYAGRWDGEFFTAKICDVCERLHQKVTELGSVEDGIVFGELRGEIELLPDAEAREKLLFLFDTNRLKRRQRWAEIQKKKDGGQ